MEMNMENEHVICDEILFTARLFFFLGLMVMYLLCFFFFFLAF